MAMLDNQIVYLYVCFQLCCESLLISHLPAECKVLDKILRPVPFQRKHFPPWSSALEVAALLQTAWGIKCETSTEFFFLGQFLATSGSKFSEAFGWFDWCCFLVANRRQCLVFVGQSLIGRYRTQMVLLILPEHWNPEHWNLC